MAEIGLEADGQRLITGYLTKFPTNHNPNFLFIPRKYSILCLYEDNID